MDKPMSDKLLRECVGVIEEMRAENRLHGQITEASSRWLNRVKPQVDAVLSPTRGALSALAVAQDALSQTLTHAEMPDTLRQQVTLAYEATTAALEGRDE